jgi:hypothetical protein
MECIICFEVAEPFMLECKHSICYNCYHKIDSCPLCRKQIKKVSIHHVQIYIEEEYDRPFLTKELCSIIMCTTCMIIIVWFSLMI